jgi:hypothetical protein
MKTNEGSPGLEEERWRASEDDSLLAMIKGIHGLFYSNRPDELRAFIRDKLMLPFTDVHDGWLIFDFKEGDLGVHPTDANDEMSGSHDISFFTDDLAGTVKELKARGVVFDDEIANRGYGLVTHFTMPGSVKVQLYQPRYHKNPKGGAKAAPKRPAKQKAASPKSKAVKATKKAAPAKRSAKVAKGKRAPKRK